MESSESVSAAALIAPEGKPSCQLCCLGAIGCACFLPSLSAHQASLEPDGSHWLLQYQIQNIDFGERLASCTDIAIPLAVGSFEDALELAEVILRGHTAPRLPETELLINSRPDPEPEGFRLLRNRKAA